MTLDELDFGISLISILFVPPRVGSLLVCDVWDYHNTLIRALFQSFFPGVDFVI